MPRPRRTDVADMVFHVINRGNARARIFFNDNDFRAFEKILTDTFTNLHVRLLAYCLMPNHWHIVLWPRRDGDLARCVHRLTTTHVRRSHLFTDRVGTGHLYQGTYKSFPIQNDDHLCTVIRYVERNPLRAGLVPHAENWQWSSLWHNTHGPNGKPALAEWPIDKPHDWTSFVNAPLTDAELEQVRVSVNRGRPYGNREWQQNIARVLGLESTLRARGRPSKKRC